MSRRITPTDQVRDAEASAGELGGCPTTDTSTSAPGSGTARDTPDPAAAMEALADRTNRLTLVAQAAAHLLRGSEPETVLEELFDEMADTLGLEIYEQFEYGDDATPCSVGGNVTWAVTEPGEAGGASVGIGTCGLAFERVEPVIYDGLDRFPDDARAAAHREGLQAYGCFPLVAGGEVFGALCFGTRGDARFDEETVQLIRTIVDYLAVGEQRLRTESQLRELNRTLESRIEEATRDLRASEEQLRRLASDLIRVEQDERQRIAQLLHDDLQQLLFGAQMRVGLLRDDLGEAAGRHVVSHLDEAERYLGESIDIARHLSGELAPTVLDDDHLGETLQWLVEQMRELHDLDVELNTSGDLHVPNRETRVVVHQTVRELLFNVVKHAGVAQARIDIAVRGAELEIHVEDAGNGFDADQAFSDPNRAGRGLATLRQRLSLVGGGLDLEAAPGDGTRAHVVLPAAALVRDG